MSNTLTPFLYNTKTLSRLARAGPATLRATLHTTPRRHYTTYDRNSDVPFELPADLTLPDPGVADSAERDSLTPNERAIFGNIFAEIQQRGQKPRILKASTAAPAQPPAAQQNELSKGKPQFLTSLLHGGSSEKLDPLTSSLAVNAILQDAAKQPSDSKMGLDPLSPLETTYSASEREKALLGFPPTLRRAARHAFGMFDPWDPQVKTEGGGKEAVGARAQPAAASEIVGAGQTAEDVAKMAQRESRRRSARLKVLARMEACSSDFEVWSVMEKQVFSLVGRLGIDKIAVNTPVEPPKAKVAKGRRKVAQTKNVAAMKEAAVVAASQTLTDAELDMETYGPMYPQLLVDGLNILGTKFTRPSPYMQHLLPRIKELGLVSYVLGVSTAFYNRLLLITWTRYGDAQGVLSLLEEMRHSGLYFDKDSLSVVSKIETTYMQAAHAERGRFVQQLMGTPEYEPVLAQRLTHWIGYITAGMRERPS